MKSGRWVEHIGQVYLRVVRWPSTRRVIPYVLQKMTAKTPYKAIPPPSWPFSIWPADLWRRFGWGHRFVEWLVKRGRGSDDDEQATQTRLREYFFTRNPRLKQSDSCFRSFFVLFCLILFSANRLRSRCEKKHISR